MLSNGGEGEICKDVLETVETSVTNKIQQDGKKTNDQNT